MGIIITNLKILGPDPEYGIFEGALVIKDQKIEEVLTGEKAQTVRTEAYPGFEIIDGNGRLAVPGMINAHYHSYANLLKGTVNDRPLDLWSLYTVAYGHSLSDEDMRLAVLLGAAEMIRNGITGVLDHFPHLLRAEAALRAYEESGLRVGFAPMMHDVPDHEVLPLNLPDDLKEELRRKPKQQPQDLKDLYARLLSWHGWKGRIEIVVGPNAPQRCTPEMLTLSRDLSLAYGLRVHTHLLETQSQREIGTRLYPQGMVHYLEDIGLLTSGLSVAHAVWLNAEEIELLGKRGVTVIHNPVSNMMLGSGRAPVRQYLEREVPLALGTDAANCSGPTSMFETMRQAVMLNRSQEDDYRRWLKPAEVWKMATYGGATALGLKGRRGFIAKGTRADFALLKTNGLSFTPLNDVVTQLVHHESGHAVDSVIINGKWVMRQGNITAFDEQKVLQEAQTRQAQLMERCRDAIRFAQKIEPFGQKMYLKSLNLPHS